MSQLPTNIPLPDLDKLHAETSAGEWRAGSVETDAVFAPCSDCMGPERVILRMNKSFPHEADAQWIVEIHNTWPTISARLKELESALAESRADLSRVMRDGYAHSDRDESRIRILEETLRGVLQEKQKRRDLMQSGAIDKAGTKAGEAYEWAKGEIEREIAWLESVLGGGE